MKKKQIVLATAAGLLLLFTLVLGALHLYSRQPTLPKGTTLAGWEVGGIDRDQVRSQLKENIQTLQSTTLTLTVEGNPGITLTLKEAGIVSAATARRTTAGLGRLLEAHQMSIPTEFRSCRPVEAGTSGPARAAAPP